MQTYDNIINGKPLASTETFESYNPATSEVLGLVARSTDVQIGQAIAAARKAQPAWAALPDANRREYLVKAAAVLEENAAYLAELVTREQGKPLTGPGSQFEIQACVDWTNVPADLELPVEVVFEDETRRDELHRKPLGVIAAIAPWNWPLLIATWQIMPSIRAGNTVVIKPSEYTPIGTLEMVRLISKVLPEGVINTVSGDGTVGRRLCENPDIDKIMFTGSAATGKKIIQASSENLARLTLELGGNDPAIVLPDADPAAIAEGLFWGAFINQGQTCACAKRLYVHEDIHDAVVAKLKGLAEAMPMGNGLNDGIVLGPVQNRRQLDIVSRLTEDAKARGATIVCGGNSIDGPGNFFPVTLVTDIENDAPLVQEEQFGPVLPVIRYSNTDDAIGMANEGDTGLGASVWSSDTEKAAAVAGRLDAGTVWINRHGVIHPMVPFGGAKKSGFGLEFGIEGLKALTQPQIISISKAEAA
ncbi:aldehyde dehydrogenase family protein [Hoeflea sp. TYP-13]|uniref:aldehyde dehydrogenase family protein n=1 Tax=Hoeflea sp. TYP-13 TaxID=3230023 RepID=UPI0034C5BCE6